MKDIKGFSKVTDALARLHSTLRNLPVNISKRPTFGPKVQCLYSTFIFILMIAGSFV